MNSSTSDNAPKEEFDQAVLRFREFLSSNGFSPNVVWIEPTDVLVTGSKRIYLHHPDREHAEIVARDTFEHGSKRGNGVVIKGVFPKPFATYSFVWFPQDKDEAELASVPSGVKLEVSLSQPFKLIAIQSSERWRELCKRHDGIQFVKMDLFR